MVDLTIINTSITTGGSFSLQKISSDSLYLIYNVGSATGSPSLVFTMAEADPVNPTTTITGGQTASTSAITEAGTGILALTGISSSCVLITWTITGGTFGTASVTIDEKFLGTASVMVAGTVNQGNPNILSKAWPVEVTDGTVVLGTESNPLSVNVISGGGSNASVGATGTTAPTSATEIGIISAGDLVGVSSANPMPISGAVTVSSGTITSITDSVAVTGTFYQATQPVSGTFYQATQPVSGTVAVSGSVAVTGTFYQAVQPVSGTFTPSLGTSGGASIYRVLSVNNTTGVNIKSSTGQVYGVTATNVDANPRFLKLYNKATAPTVGTDTPVMTFLIPGNTVGAGIVIPLPMGVYFSLGIGQGITQNVADNDTTAPAANEVITHVFYY